MTSGARPGLELNGDRRADSSTADICRAHRRRSDSGREVWPSFHVDLFYRARSAGPVNSAAATAAARPGLWRQVRDDDGQERQPDDVAAAAVSQS